MKKKIVKKMKTLNSKSNFLLENERNKKRKFNNEYNENFI